MQRAHEVFVYALFKLCCSLPNFMKSFSRFAILLLLSLMVILTSVAATISQLPQNDASLAAAQSTTHTNTHRPENTSSISTERQTSTMTTKPGRRGGLPPGLAKAWAHSNMSVVARAVTMAIFLNDTHGTALSRIAINASSTDQLIKNVAYNQTVVHVKFDRDGLVVLIINASAKPAVVYGDDLKLSEKLSTLGLTPDSEAWVYDNNKRIIIIFADPLTITLSYLASQQALTTTTTSQPATGPRCVIASAAYGSELAPQVQFLRMFRDKSVQSTFAGCNFMKAFNAFYYSFSPAVALMVAENHILSQIARMLLYPLVTILQLSSSIFHLLGFTSEIAVVASGVFASASIGISYMTPLLAFARIVNKPKRKRPD